MNAPEDWSMNSLVLDSDLPAKLQGLEQQVEILDEHGKSLGVYVPKAIYGDFVLSLQMPFSIEEIQRLRKERGGCTLAEFWQRMGRTCDSQ
jgi:hypothetical protein